MRTFKRLISAVFVCLSCLTPPVQAISIQYEALDLSDSASGEDLWQYRYFVGDHTFFGGSGFSVYFDTALYSSLEIPLSLVNPDWDVLTLQPDLALPAAGLYDALALVTAASLSDPFTVNFLWLGGPTAAPGPQPFELYNLTAASGLTVLTSGHSVARTIPVPEPISLAEPGTLGLAGLGLLVFALFRLAMRAGRSRLACQPVTSAGSAERRVSELTYPKDSFIATGKTR